MQCVHLSSLIEFSSKLCESWTPSYCLHDAIANHFRKVWGKEAGWAHSVLFTADLKVFAERLQSKLVVKEEEEKKITVSTVVKESLIQEQLENLGTKRVLEIDQTAVSSSERVKRRKRK